MCHSWERVMSFPPWVTHRIQLRAFIVHKMPKSMRMLSCTGKELHLLPQKEIPVNYQMIGYESHLHSLVSHQRGTLLLLHI